MYHGDTNERQRLKLHMERREPVVHTSTVSRNCLHDFMQIYTHTYSMILHREIEVYVIAVGL